MKKIIFHLFIFLLGMGFSFEAGAVRPGKAVPDSAALAELDRALVQSLDQMVASKPFARQYQEVREFLSVIADSCTRRHLALKCYDYYIQSPLNGSEEVAVMMVDSLFSPKIIPMDNDVELLNARIYAEFNRATLLGRKAPALTLYDKNRNPVGMPAASQDKYSVIYFYSADCPKCKVETELLCKMLEEENPPARLYAVYTDDNPEKWHSYVDKDFHLEASHLEVVHLWDPDYESDFRHSYGVLQTPKMFLLDKNDNILGRSLDTYALKLMMHGIEELHPYVYGSEESDKSFEEMFSQFQPELTFEDIRFFLSYTEKMFPKGDPQFKHTAGDLMFYLCRHRFRGAAYLRGAEYVADSLVKARPHMWTTETDSLQVLSFCDYVKQLSALLPVGALVPDLRLKGDLWTVLPSARSRRSSGKGGYVRTKRWNLQEIGLPVYVVMYTEDCSNCRAVLAAVRDFMSMAKPGDEGADKMNFLLVDVGKLEKKHPRCFDKLVEQFDLSFMPFIFQLDEKGLVVDKYIYL